MANKFFYLLHFSKRAAVVAMVALLLLSTGCKIEDEGQTYLIIDMETEEPVAIMYGKATATEDGIEINDMEFPNCIAVLTPKESEEWNTTTQQTSEC